MTREEGIRQIEAAPWRWDDGGVRSLQVTDENGHDVHVWLSMRPVYCDRGHIQLNIDMIGKFSEPALDGADSLPRPKLCC